MTHDLGHCSAFDSTQYECEFLGDPIDEPSGTICNHGAVIVGHLLYVFGGDYAWSGDLALFCCDLIEEEWSAIPLDDQGPNFRTVCNAFIHNDSIVAWSSDPDEFKMHRLNCLTLGGWTEIENRAGVPMPKKWGSTQGTFHEGRQEAFLYENADSGLYIVDVVRDRSTKAVTKGGIPNRYRKFKLTTGGNVLMFVGLEYYSRRNTVVLELSTMTYSKLACNSFRVEAAVGSHCAAMVYGRVFVMGGTGCNDNIEILTMKDKTWRSVLHSSYQYKSRYAYQKAQKGMIKLEGDGIMGLTTGHALAVTPNQIIIIGGRAPNYEDFCFVSISPLDSGED